MTTAEARLTDAIERLRVADAALIARSGPMPLPIAGLEEIIAGSVSALQAGDWWVPGMRERVGGVLRDLPIDRIVDGMRGARPYKIAPPTPQAALRALITVGLAQANPDQAALTHLGIGSVSDGAFHEALNLSALLGCNAIFVVAVHPLGEGAPIGRQTAASPADLARAYGIGVQLIDGNDVAAVHAAAKAARDDRGPNLIEARLR